MRRRPSARFLVLDPAGRLLLFRYVFTKGALAGEDYWSTPGGALDGNETFEQAAVRGLQEETGIRELRVMPQVANRQLTLRLADGEHVPADERYFVIEASGENLSRADWTEQEREVMTEHRWWTRRELADCPETVYAERSARNDWRLRVIYLEPRYEVRQENYRQCRSNH